METEKPSQKTIEQIVDSAAKQIIQHGKIVPKGFGSAIGYYDNPTPLPESIKKYFDAWGGTSWIDTPKGEHYYFISVIYSPEIKTGKWCSWEIARSPAEILDLAFASMHKAKSGKDIMINYQIPVDCVFKFLEFIVTKYHSVIETAGIIDKQGADEIFYTKENLQRSLADEKAKKQALMKILLEMY